MIVGITGGIGAGKSYVSSLFADRGFTVIDADEVCRGIYHGDCLREVVSAFGDEILKDDGTLDRKALGGIVFGDREGLDTLNSIAHRYIDAEIKKMIAAAKTKHVLIDAPQLFEAGVDRECDEVIYVHSPAEERIARVMARDGLSAEQVKRRMAMQYDEDFFRKKCSYVIDNREGIDIAPQIQQIIDKMESNNGNQDR